MNTDLELAINATMAMLDRYGGLWGSDHEHVRKQLEVIIEAAMDLGSDDPGWADARDQLTAMLYVDIP